MARVHSSSMATDLVWGAPLNEDDLAGMPDDGHRYELINGVLLVSPSPGLAHQRCVGNVFVALHGARQAGYEVLVAPFDVRLSRVTVVVPDVLVARSADLTPARLKTAPVLAVEVGSPSTALIDRAPSDWSTRPPACLRTGWSTPTGPVSPCCTCTRVTTSSTQS